MENFMTHENLKRRDPTQVAEALLKTTNALWHELALKSKPCPEIINRELLKLKVITNELRAQFSKGEAAKVTLGTRQEERRK